MKKNRFVLILICYYQKYIASFLIPSCRFYPTCSQYAKRAFIKYNFIKAFLLSFYRILRCNPWNKGGFDPLK